MINSGMSALVMLVNTFSRERAATNKQSLRLYFIAGISHYVSALSQQNKGKNIVSELKYKPGV